MLNIIKLWIVDNIIKKIINWLPMHKIEEWLKKSFKIVIPYSIIAFTIQYFLFGWFPKEIITFPIKIWTIIMAIYGLYALFFIKNK